VPKIFLLKYLDQHRVPVKRTVPIQKTKSALGFRRIRKWRELSRGTNIVEYADGRMKLEEVVETHVTPLRVKFQRRPTTLPEFNKFRAISK
jgi:glutathione synthase/RimK-type ligase-like ATP-grasp enzyme